MCSQAQNHHLRGQWASETTITAGLNINLHKFARETSISVPAAIAGCSLETACPQRDTKIPLVATESAPVEIRAMRNPSETSLSAQAKRGLLLKCNADPIIFEDVLQLKFRKLVIGCI